MIEIEIKAWLADLPATAAIVGTFAKSAGERSTADEYWAPRDFHWQGTATPWNTVRVLRLRRFAMPDGERAALTFKRKSVDASGIETSAETEFAVPGDDAARMLDYIGYTRLEAKRKRTLLFDHESGAQIELSHVDGLGAFIEIERLLPDDASKIEKDAARAAITELLKKAGAEKSAIERRPYVGMLLGRQAFRRRLAMGLKRRLSRSHARVMCVESPASARALRRWADVADIEPGEQIPDNIHAIVAEIPARSTASEWLPMLAGWLGARIRRLPTLILGGARRTADLARMGRVGLAEMAWASADPGTPWLPAPHRVTDDWADLVAIGNFDLLHEQAILSTASASGFFVRPTDVRP